MLCGDEVGAIVADMGSHLCRFGAAGEDSPPHIWRSDIGIYENGNSIVGDSHLRAVRGNLEIKSLFGSDEIDWDATEAMLEYGMMSCLRTSETRSPLLLAENYFNTAEKKEKLYELLFEKMRLPAAYTCHNATLGSFCAARPSSLVVDMGADEIRIVPVVDGFSLNRSIIRSSRGGNSMDRCVETCLLSRQSKKRECGEGGSEIMPWFLCKGRHSPPNLKDSFIRAHVNDVIRDVKHWMCFVPHSQQTGSIAKESSSAIQSLEDSINLIPPYELPDGTVVSADQDLCLCIERQLFPTQLNSPSSNSSKRGRRSRASGGDPSTAADVNDEDPLHRLIYNAVDKCDVDVRKELLGNIVLIGAGALLEGLAQRLSSEIPKMVPSNVKVKVVTSMSAIEKHHAAWIGGSILSICGSFQQLWISREEYEEYGPRVYKGKCQH